MEKSENHLLREHAKRAGRERGGGRGERGEGKGELTQLHECTACSDITEKV